jgi:aspartate carbamoyltransferase catalytic subunit
MHPGPVNLGVESSVDLARLPQSVVARQVANGVPVRMAVLFDALAGVGVAMEDA